MGEAKSEAFGNQLLPRQVESTLAKPSDRKTTLTWGWDRGRLLLLWNLSRTVAKVMNRPLSPPRYGPELTPLLERAGIAPLDAGQPVTGVTDQLRKLLRGGRFAGLQIVDEAAARACMAGLWLRFNELDESHRISQELHSSTGSYWHAIMHRREGDFGNSKYWFRQTGQHPVLDQLTEAVRELTAQYETTGESLPEACRALVSRGAWDPFRFVDVCEAVVRGRLDAERWCREVQQCEWQRLFDDCFARAVQGNES